MGSAMSYALGLGPDRPPPAGILAVSGFIQTLEHWEPDVVHQIAPGAIPAAADWLAGTLGT